jgi:hypothetical protein
LSSLATYHCDRRVDAVLYRMSNYKVLGCALCNKQHHAVSGMRAEGQLLLEANADNLR